MSDIDQDQIPLLKSDKNMEKTDDKAKLTLLEICKESFSDFDNSDDPLDLEINKFITQVIGSENANNDDDKNTPQEFINQFSLSRILIEIENKLKRKRPPIPNISPAFVMFTVAAGIFVLFFVPAMVFFMSGSPVALPILLGLVGILLICSITSIIYRYVTRYKYNSFIEKIENFMKEYDIEPKEPLAKDEGIKNEIIRLSADLRDTKEISSSVLVLSVRPPVSGTGGSAPEPLSNNNAVPINVPEGQNGCQTSSP